MEPIQQQPSKRRRYRIPRSCDRCRTSKIKCVFQDGQCAACASARVSCTFANPGSLKERPPTQKDVEYLEARIRSLERLIHAIDPALDLSSLPNSIDSNQTLTAKTYTDQPSHSELPDLPSEKFSPIFLQIHDPQSDPLLASLFFPSQLKLNDSPVPPSLASIEGLSPVDKIIRQEHAKKTFWNYSLYPEPDLEQSLIELYFKNVHPCLPLLHPATFVQDLQSGLSRTSDSFRALCLTMMAISSRFSKDSRVFLDLDDCPQPSLQVAGLRYAMVAASYIFQPINTPADIHDLQAILLLVIYALGTTNPHAAWDIVGLGLQRAQEAGAHLEKSPKWLTCPIQHHLRRKAFTVLYEFDCFLSAAIGKPSYMQESDFDVLPPDLDFDTAIGTFSNPFSEAVNTNGAGREEMKFSNDVSLAYSTLKTSFGGLKNLFPLMDVMKARKDSYSGINFLSCIEILIKQLDASMTQCYEKIAKKFTAYQSSNANITDCQLTSSVHAVTWYHEFRLLTHKVLFGYKGGNNNSRGETKSSPNDNKNYEDLSKTATIKSHAEICIESAKMIIGMINRLHERNLLELGFYWIPLRITNALIILITSLKKFRKTLSPEQRHLIHYEISLGIQILNTLAPTTFLAGKCSTIMSGFQRCLLHRDQRHDNNKSSSFSPAAKPPSASTSPHNGSIPLPTFED